MRACIWYERDIAVSADGGKGCEKVAVGSHIGEGFRAPNARSVNNTFLMYSHGIVGAVRSCDKVDEGKILGRGAERLMRARGAQLG